MSNISSFELNKRLRNEIFELSKDLFYLDKGDNINTLAKFIFNGCLYPNISFEEIKENIFRECLSYNGAILQTTNNLLKILALYIICKVKNWFQKNPSKNRNYRYNSDERVLSMLRNLYHQYDLNYDIMQFVILNTQVALAKDDSIFANLRNRIGISDSLKIVGIPYDGKNKTFISGTNIVECMSNVQTYCKLLAADIGDRNLNNNLSQTKLLESLRDLLEAMDFFAHVDININADHTVDFIDSGKVVNGFELLRTIDDPATGVETLVYLNSIRREDSGLNLIYSELNDARSHTFDIRTTASDDANVIVCDSIENFYVRVTGHILANRQVNLGIPGLLSYNYKYINKLALAIVDSIEGNEYNDCRLNLVSLMLRNEIFFRDELTLANINDGIEGNENYDLLNWDLVLMKILTFESPTRVLRTLFNEGKNINVNIIDKIMINLNLRLQDSFDIEKAFLTREHLQKEVESQLAIFNQGSELVDEKFLKNWRNHIKLESSIRALVSALADAQDGSKTTLRGTNVYISSIYDRVNFLDNINYNATSAWERTKTTCDTMLIEVLKTYLCFYEGIVGAVAERLSYETETFNRCLNNKELHQWQEKIEKTFISNVRKKAEDLSKLTTPTQYLIELKNTYESCFKYQTNHDVMTSYGKAIRATLGRDMIDFDEFIKLVEYDGQDVSIKYFNTDGSENVVMLDNINHENIYNYVIGVKNILKFFAGNLNPNDTQVRKFRKMIFPATATFSGNRTNRDRNSIMQFSLIINDRGTGENIDKVSSNTPQSHRLNEVSISTEFSYQINEHFYCLPNIDRLTGYLWADPILIQCEKFNRAMMLEE